jgi:hypothetical protein
MALSWGVMWIPVNLAYMGYRIYEDLPHLTMARLVPFGVAAGAEGFVAGALTGAAFAAVLALLERRKRIGDLLPWRISWYGGLAGGLAVSTFGVVDAVSPGSMPARWLGEMILIYTAVGTVMAASTLALARRRAVESVSRTVRHRLSNPRHLRG